ncbi:hypothetical protein [Clostridium sp. C8-1-8]|uniref:hypothetical protein n=1 Tax=Clostridium sp. C8-1-8 TaxID=2698831 RepID=UPI00136E50EF|nr:hypothetical protein [Clostridium sp. C8-1-8]
MDFIFKVLIIIYGGLDIIAGVASLKHKKSSRLGSIIMMLAGGMLIGLGFIRANRSINITALFVGLILTHIAAVLNGIKMYGKINKLHHIVRLIISIGIISLYFGIK